MCGGGVLVCACHCWHHQYFARATAGTTDWVCNARRGADMVLSLKEGREASLCRVSHPLPRPALCRHPRWRPSLRDRPIAAPKTAPRNSRHCRKKAETRRTTGVRLAPASTCTLDGIPKGIDSFATRICDERGLLHTSCTRMDAGPGSRRAQGHSSAFNSALTIELLSTVGSCGNALRHDNQTAPESISYSRACQTATTVCRAQRVATGQSCTYLARVG